MKKHFILYVGAIVLNVSYSMADSAHSEESLKKSSISNYFKNTYEESDEAFNQSINKIQQISPESKKIDFNYSQGNVRTYVWKSQKKSENAVVIISGTHGVEGFVGSAVQRWLIDQDFTKQRKNTDIILIHGLNVYGFKNQRRVNEDNVDLNRNFLIEREHFSIDDTAYNNLNDFLNPERSAEYSFLSKAKFLAEAGIKILKFGLENLRNPILQGQYTLPKGIFYGGSKNAPQAELLKKLANEELLDYKKIILIDLHTGYGKKGKLHLLAGAANDKNSEVLKKIFNPLDVDFGDQKSFYLTHGEMIKYLQDLILSAKTENNVTIANITFEYGTLDSQTSLGSIESLRRIVYENQNHWHEAQSMQENQKIKQEFLEMFYPQDTAWYEQIIEQSDKHFRTVFNWLK
ncbi:MAG: DUF2817 domain-containing protein [Pseudobdellovibrio sp.]